MIVIKIGGNEIDSPDFIYGIGEAVSALDRPPIIVHGGGKEIRKLQNQLGLEPKYIDGLRVTDAQSLDVVKMVLAGRINKRLAASLLSAGVDAFGMSGVDRASIKVKKIEHLQGDLGHVGEVTEVRTEVFTHLLEYGITPVLSPICYGADGAIFNVNADHVAMAIAIAMKAAMLVFISNVPGVLRDGNLFHNLTIAEIEQLIREKIIIDGMIPKVRSAISAVNEGVSTVQITNLHGLKEGTGTTIIK